MKTRKKEGQNYVGRSLYATVAVFPLLQWWKIETWAQSWVVAVVGVVVPTTNATTVITAAAVASSPKPFFSLKMVLFDDS